jgi:hypothetical protein
VVLQFLGGLSLFVFARRTADFFAWTIPPPLTASFMGAGYWAALVIFALALFSAEWQRVRVIFVSTLFFSLPIVLITFDNLSTFHLDEGPFLAQLAAWIWLIAYVAIPALMLVSLILQERGGGSREYAISRPLDPLVRVGLVLQGVILTTLSVALFFFPSDLRDVWPWPVTPLAAGAVAAWIFSFGISSFWVLRDGDWDRVRITIPFYLLFYALLIMAALRFWDTFASDDRRAAYVAAVIAAFVLTSFAAWRQERAVGVFTTQAAEI